MLAGLLAELSPDGTDDAAAAAARMLRGLMHGEA
jgi:hypothetical protein